MDVPRGMCYGQTDVPLKETFEQEAKIVKANLEKLSFQLVYTSPLSRCTRLATFCGYGDAERDSRLLELNFGEWEWKPLYEMDQPDVHFWFKNQIAQPTPGGESINQQKERFQHFLQEKKQQGLKSIALFAHGGIMLCAMLLQGKTFEGDDLFLHLPAYGSILEFQF